MRGSLFVLLILSATLADASLKKYAKYISSAIMGPSKSSRTINEEHYDHESRDEDDIVVVGVSGDVQFGDRPEAAVVDDSEDTSDPNEKGEKVVVDDEFSVDQTVETGLPGVDDSQSAQNVEDNNILLSFIHEQADKASMSGMNAGPSAHDDDATLTEFHLDVPVADQEKVQLAEGQSDSGLYNVAAESGLTSDRRLRPLPRESFEDASTLNLHQILAIGGVLTMALIVFTRKS